MNSNSSTQAPQIQSPTETASSSLLGAIPPSFAGTWYSTDDVTQGAASRHVIDANTWSSIYAYPGRGPSGTYLQTFNSSNGTFTSEIVEINSPQPGGTYQATGSSITLFQVDVNGDSFSDIYTVNGDTIVETGDRIIGQVIYYRSGSAQAQQIEVLFNQLNQQ